MDFERIQQLASTARVLRANSEQQRRRRDQNAREFSEMLEENLDEETSSADTATPTPQPHTGQDTVTLSSTGKVSAETLRAAGTLARISLAQRQMLELFNPGFSTVADGTDQQPAGSSPTQVDELA